MSAGISDTINDGVEYLYTSDTELDEESKCGEIFICFSSFDCVFLCTLCKNRYKYSTFDDFTDHIRGQHTNNEQGIQPPSPTGGFIAEIAEEDIKCEKLDFYASDEGEIEYAHSIKSEGGYEELESFICTETSPERGAVELDHDMEMLISDEDCISDSEFECIDKCMTELLDTYRKCICLWHTKTANNTSSEIKASALTLVFEKYSMYYPDRTLNDLEDRLYGLTKRFKEEYRRLKKDNPDEPKTWYFKQLKFLRCAEDEEILDEDFQDFNCPICRNCVALSSIDLWNHMTAQHLKVHKKNVERVGQKMQQVFTLQCPEKFIDLYREQECLWNTKSAEYYNRSLKANAYDVIIQKYNEISPNILTDHESVKRAIKQLRNFFGRVDRKYHSYEQPDKNARSLSLKKFEIYQKLLFLKKSDKLGRSPIEQIYSSDLRQKTFNEKNELNEHDDISTSDKCPLAFTSQYEIETRSKEHAKTYTCPICQTDFRNSEDLAIHLNEHLPEKAQKQVCEICGIKFNDRSNLLIHIRRHNNTKNYTCNICSKGFVTSTELKSHFVVHSDERPFVCETCGLRFKYSNRLNTHRLLHGEPKFKCMNCNMKFVIKRHLTDHQRTHAQPGEQKVKCDVCGTLFRNRDSLSRHKRKIHNIKKRGQESTVL